MEGGFTASWVFMSSATGSVQSVSSCHCRILRGATFIKAFGGTGTVCVTDAGVWEAVCAQEVFSS